MKLATLKSSDKNNRDGQLIVVSKDLTKAVTPAPELGPSLKQAVENWATVSASLESLYSALNTGTATGAFNLDLNECIAPLPNAASFYDGSAFLTHVDRARRSRGDVMPESAKVTPLMYQGVSDALLGWNTPLEIMDEANGGDFEGEFYTITTDVPKGTKAEAMSPYMVLFGMFNDITLREIVKKEIVTKFGFLQAKPNSSFAPVVVTPDELEGVLKNGRIELDMEVTINGETFGNPNGREMHFSFEQLVAHAGRTRPLSASSIIGTGTVSNEDKARGFATLTEARAQEMIDNQGTPKTPWFKVGDHLHIDVQMNGQSVFGCVDQKVVL